MQDKKKHIALITTWFPPKTGVAVNRMNAFVKYLDKEKFSISVFTIGESESMEHIDPIDIYRIPDKRIFNFFQSDPSDNKIKHKLKVLYNVIVRALFTEYSSKWISAICNKLLVLNQVKPIDLVISSYSPVDCHIAANKFCNEKTNTRWIADMRDEMSFNPFLSKRSQKSLQQIEKRISKNITAITTVSKPILDTYRSIFPSVKYFEEIRNGYDHNFEPILNFNEIFTIGYAGTFYGHIKPTTFFKALENLINKGAINDNWKIVFLGTHHNFDYPTKYKEKLIFLPPKDSDGAIQHMLNVDCNLLINPTMGRKGVYTGKLFEYISVEKPILALVDKNDVAAKLIIDQNAGYVADFNNIQEIENAFIQIFTLWKEKKTLKFDKEKVKSLHRKTQVYKLETLIDKILS